MTRKPAASRTLADRFLRRISPTGYGTAILGALALCGLAAPGLAQAPPASPQAPPASPQAPPASSQAPPASPQKPAGDKPAAGTGMEKGKPADKEEGDDDDDDDDDKPAGKKAAAQSDKNGGDENKHPQPVRVGDLIGRAVIAPQESQNLLGRVRKLVRDREGEVNLVMNYGGYFGTSFGSHLVCVSVDDVALTGYQIQAREIDADELGKLPVCDGGADKPLDANETIKVNLAKPAH